jgi:hypothetical protein
MFNLYNDMATIYVAGSSHKIYSDSDSWTAARQQRDILMRFDLINTTVKARKGFRKWTEDILWRNRTEVTRCPSKAVISCWRSMRPTSDRGTERSCARAERRNRRTVSLSSYWREKNGTCLFLIYFVNLIDHGRSRGSSVSTVSGYRLNYRAIEVRSPAEGDDFSSSLCPDQLWGPPSLLFNGYWG